MVLYVIVVAAMVRHASKLEKQMAELDNKHDAIADIKSAHDSDEMIDGKLLCSM